MSVLVKPIQQQAAFLEAQGYKRGEIATALGISSKTVSDWRNHPEYRAEVVRWADADLERMSGLLARLKVDVIDAASAATVTLRDALAAELKDGRPDWSVRLRAAQVLAEWVGVASARVGDDGQVPTSAAAAVLVVAPNDSGGFSVVEQHAVRSPIPIAAVPQGT